MSDRKFYTLVGIGLFVVISFAVIRQINATRDCDAKHGTLINTRSSFICIRSDAVLN